MRGYRLSALLCLAALWIPWGAKASPALLRGVDYLVSQQQADGSWRSATYGGLKDGVALTGLVVTTLHAGGGRDPRVEAAVARGLAFLERSTAEPSFRQGYPLYNGCFASWALRLKPGFDPGGLRYDLERRQFETEDSRRGGWGYAVLVGSTPEAVRPLGTSNVSSTVFALGALHGMGALTPEIRKAAAAYLARLQDLSSDGGFCFSPDDHAANKAGAATDGLFTAYGSTTADGLRAMLLCGDAVDSERRSRAARWLTNHFSAAQHPGAFATQREVLRNSYYFYWCWSAAHALHRLGLRETKSGPWAPALISELSKRQRQDGSWRNEYTDAKEDDPLIATSFALAAMGISMAVDRGTAHQSHLFPVPAK